MKISIITNNENDNFANELINAFAFIFSKLSDTVLFCNNFKVILKKRNEISNKKMFQVPLEDFHTKKFRILKNNFYLFWFQTIFDAEIIAESDVVLFFIELNEMNETILFKKLKALMINELDLAKIIFVPWTNNLDTNAKINLICLEKYCHKKVLNKIFCYELTNAKDYAKIILKKIQEK